jgi:hypothetical protein
MIGKALIVAWSFTLNNLGPVPQVINIGTAPTNENYIPVMAVIKNMDVSQTKGLVITIGTSEQTPNNVVESINAGDNSNPTEKGYMIWGLGGNSIAPAAQNLYVKYSENNKYNGEPITIDILAYPSN